MNKKEKKVLRINNKEITINIATCIMLVVVVYMIISLIIAAGKEPVETYKVNSANINNNIVLNGLIVREEELIVTSSEGYVNYFIRDGEKAMREENICAIDQTGQLNEIVANMSDYSSLLDEKDYKELRTLITTYKFSYQDIEFYNSYSFETDINNKIIEIANEMLLEDGSAAAGTGINISAVKAPQSGIVTYYVDGFEDYNTDSVSAKDFNKASYQKNMLKMGEKLNANSVVAKLVTSENWNIIAPITDEAIAAIDESEYVNIKINNSKYTVKVPYTIISEADGKYINISMNKYMSNYLSERYLDVEIIRNEDVGLKVPVTSIVEKEVYKVPAEYFTGGGNQNYKNRLNICVDSDSIGESIRQISPSIYYYGEDEYYVSKEQLDEAAVIMDIKSDRLIPVASLETEVLSGVYLANKGVTEFIGVDIVKALDDFVLVKSGSRFREYDIIIKDASKVSENEIVY